MPVGSLPSEIVAFPLAGRFAVPNWAAPHPGIVALLIVTNWPARLTGWGTADAVRTLIVMGARAVTELFCWGMLPPAGINEIAVTEPTSGIASKGEKVPLP